VSCPSTPWPARPDIAETIAEGGGWYLLAVKDNQFDLYANLRQCQFAACARGWPATPPNWSRSWLCDDFVNALLVRDPVTVQIRSGTIGANRLENKLKWESTQGRRLGPIAD